MSFLLIFQEHKLASACVTFAVALTTLVIALLILQADATSADLQGVVAFDAVTTNFTSRIETAFNASLVPLEVLASLCGVFNMSQFLFQNFLNQLPELTQTLLTPGLVITFDPYVEADDVTTFQDTIRMEGGLLANYTIFNLSTPADVDPNVPDPPHVPVTYWWPANGTVLPG
jgi:hypothetical protein